MKRLIVLCAVALTVLLVVAPVVGCQQQPQPAATPSLAIMVESNIVEAGSSFMVSGSIHAMIPIPEDVLPGNYEVSIYIGKLYDRELIATLPIHIQAVK